ncbi:MAG: hypothetical protein ACRD0G_03530 [Acidimicrobiales bacterium]
MEDEDVISRLRALGGRSVGAGAAAGHLDRALAAAATRRRRWPVVVVASLAAVTVATGVVTAVSGGGRPETIGVLERPDDVPPTGDLSCDGPPPFAGQPPVGDTEEERASNRAAEAAEFAQWRAENCPAPATSEPPATEPPATSEPADDPCTGPPPFAGVPAEPADPAAGIVPSPRAAEAAAHAAQRQECHDGPTTTTAPPPIEPATNEVAPAGPPVSVPAGPPEGVPAGPPEGAGDPPEGVPGDPPEHAGPPDDRPAAPPDVPPASPPDITPGGPPDNVPGGPPDDAPGGPPDDVPGGRPDGPGNRSGGGRG